MDNSKNEELVGIQNIFTTNYGSHVLKMKEIFEETDIKGNNNLFNTLKTEASSKHDHGPSPLFQVKCPEEKNLEVDNSLFSYSSFKKAMDLRTHNRTLDGKRTIFDDAEYFAKNHCYKLLPITFEQVDETIIQFEHNYSLSALNSESEAEEDCSRTMDYTQIKEKNYKRRRTKFCEKEVVERGTHNGDKKSEVESSPMLFQENEDFPEGFEHRNTPVNLSIENSTPVQPLDLSASPLVQEEKTDSHLRELPNSIAGNNKVAQLDFDKENVNSELNGIRVTITRPDEKENYQPCDLFLNDIARLVPWLIDKDCFEIDILDRTCDPHEIRNHRLYYVISESTWRLFQGTNERVILTNDRSLGQPLRKADKDERPSYLVFDQFSLAKCLADYCQEIGGCFEYTCIEEGKDDKWLQEEPGEEMKKISESVEEAKKVEEVVGIGCKIKEAKEEEKESYEVKEKEANREEQHRMNKHLETNAEAMEEMKKKVEKEFEVNKIKLNNNQYLEKESSIENRAEAMFASSPTEKVTQVTEKTKPKPIDNKAKGGNRAKPMTAEIKETKERGRAFKRKKDSIHSEPKTPRLTTRLKSTSESVTSQKSDRPVSKEERKNCGGPTFPKEPPKKRNKTVDPDDLLRKTRSGKMLGEVRINKPTPKRKGSRSSRRGRTREVVKSKTDGERNLRSQKIFVGRGEPKDKVKFSKSRGRKK